MNKYQVGDIILIKSYYFSDELYLVAQVLDIYGHDHRYEILESNRLDLYPVGYKSMFITGSPFYNQSVFYSEYLAKKRFQEDLEDLLNEEA